MLVSFHLHQNVGVVSSTLVCWCHSIYIGILHQKVGAIPSASVSSFRTIYISKLVHVDLAEIQKLSLQISKRNNILWPYKTFREKMALYAYANSKLSDHVDWRAVWSERFCGFQILYKEPDAKWNWKFNNTDWFENYHQIGSASFFETLTYVVTRSVADDPKMDIFIFSKVTKTYHGTSEKKTTRNVYTNCACSH